MGKLINTIIRNTAKLFSGELSQELSNGKGSGACAIDSLPSLIRQTAAEGCVLLKNDGVLPLSEDKTVALFGRCQYDYFFVGYGSGGDVKAPYKVNLVEGLNNGGVKLNRFVEQQYKTWCSKRRNKPDEGFWGHWPFSFPEMPVDRSFVDGAARTSDIAIVVIGRAAGEDRENVLQKGCFYLADQEKNLLDKVTAAFDKVVVVLDIGNIIDMSWIEEYGDRISAVLLSWQGGMESGNAVADILTGKVNPCGKLTDTIARHYEDYPSSKNFGNRDKNYYVEDIYVGYRFFETFAQDKVLYPFGYGLSYTDFAVNGQIISRTEDELGFEFVIKNIGNCSGRYTLELYCKQPQGKLSKPARILVGFGKTRVLAPQESQQINIIVPIEYLASFDDAGKTAFVDCFLLEEGDYEFLYGADCRCSEIAGVYHLDNTKLISSAVSILPVPENDLFDRIYNNNGSVGYEKIPCRTNTLKQRITENIVMSPINHTGKDKGYLLKDVADGKITLDDFVSQLSDKELEALTRGEGAMRSPLGTAGNAGIFGGTIKSLRDKGVLPVVTSDGPSGLRLQKTCALLPCGTLIACTWDKELVGRLFAELAKEIDYYNIDVILSPGMNIHRNPLCGRNFEYYSEDPLVSGKIAKHAIIGIQSNGKSACPKHFACNNQETNRQRNNSVVSIRALREIYLRGFEIAVKEASPDTIMTSYNKINGVWSHYNYDLCHTVLRSEWGYKGVILTDWWMQYAPMPEFPSVESNGYRVRAGVDVLMPGTKRCDANKKDKDDGTLFASMGKEGGITYAEIYSCVKNVLGFVLRKKL